MAALMARSDELAHGLTSVSNVSVTEASGPSNVPAARTILL